MSLINIQDPQHPSEIIINFMFSGDYLDKNIGHEIINLYKADATDQNEGQQYVYLCQDGKFNPEEHPNIKRVFFVRRTGNSGEMEILGFTDGTLQYIQPQYRDATPNNSDRRRSQEAFDALEVRHIKYGGVCIQDIFKNNAEQQLINVTFLAERVIRPKEPLYIHLRENGVDNHKIFNASRNLRTYIKEGSADYQYLAEKISEINASNSKPLTIITTDDEETETTASEIWGIQDYELAYSNALKFFIDKYPQLFRSFFEKVCPIDNLGEYVQTLREWQNIDLIVEFKKGVIIIENKILSDLNGVSEKNKNTTQLEKYYKIINRIGEPKDNQYTNDSISYLKSEKPKFFFLLTPDHNDLDLGQHPQWKKIYYSDLYNHLKNSTEKNQDSYFADFMRAISNHCDKDYHYTIMRKRFVRAIKKSKKHL